MKALTYIKHGKFALTEKPKPELIDSRDAIVRVTLGSICTSDLHIKHGCVPRAVPGITVGHEIVGIVEAVGSSVSTIRPGDRVTVNVETFCGKCFFCKHGFVNNCSDPNGGWALGCRIDGGQAEFVRVPYADQGLNRIPDAVTDEQALFVGDVRRKGQKILFRFDIPAVKGKDGIALLPQQFRGCRAHSAGGAGDKYIVHKRHPQFRIQILYQNPSAAATGGVFFAQGQIKRINWHSKHFAYSLNFAWEVILWLSVVRAVCAAT